jgi:hypothetical protein
MINLIWLEAEPGQVALQAFTDEGAYLSTFPSDLNGHRQLTLRYLGPYDEVDIYEYQLDGSNYAFNPATSMIRPVIIQQ